MLIVDDLVPKHKSIELDREEHDLTDYTDYKMVSAEVVKQTDKEIHISTLWRKGG